MEVRKAMTKEKKRKTGDMKQENKKGRKGKERVKGSE